MKQQVSTVALVQGSTHRNCSAQKLFVPNAQAHFGRSKKKEREEEIRTKKEVRISKKDEVRRKKK